MSHKTEEQTSEDPIEQAPYAMISEEERRRRAEERLAHHARIWDAEIASYKANLPQNEEEHEHVSVMTIDSEWREKERALARADAESRTNYEISWQHSLRTDERLVEMRLGRVNPVVFYEKVNPVSVAIKNILEMPVYVPVVEKLPPDLAERNKRFLAEKLNHVEHSPDVENLEIPMTDDFSYESESDYADKLYHEADEISNSMKPVQKSSRYESMIPAGETAQKADNIARAITMSQLYEKKEPKFDLNEINRQVIIEKEQIITPLIKPVVSVNSLTCVSPGNGSNTTSFKLKNIGDCSVEVEIRLKDMTAAAERDKNKRSTERLAPLQQEEEDVKSNTSAAPSISRRSDINRPPPSPVSLLGQVKAKQLYNTKCKNGSFTKSGIMTSKTLDNASTQLAKREDMIEKMIDKSAMPPHLRILASRCVEESSESHSKIVLATRGSKWLVGAGDTTEIEFVVPEGKDDEQPGIILEEYEVIVQPPCEVVFESKDDIKSGSENIVQEKNGTRICVRCYGISNECLELAKEISNQADAGRKVLENYYITDICASLVFEIADYAFVLSNQHRKEEEQFYESTLESAKHLEDIVVDCYQKNIIKAKYVPKEDNERRDYLFELFTNQFGYNYSISKVFDDNFGVDGNSRFDELQQPNIAFFLQSIPKSIEAVNMLWLEFAKNSVWAVKAKSLSQVSFKFHYLYENLNTFDKFRRNSFDLVRKRLIGLISDCKGKEKIAINETPVSEQYELENAVRGTVLNTVLFARFEHSKIVTLLTDKLVNFILPSLAKEVFIQRGLKKCVIADDGKFFAPTRANYDGNLVDLLMLAAATAVLNPIWDIFNCLQIKAAADLFIKSEEDERRDHESEIGAVNGNANSEVVSTEETPEEHEWSCIRLEYLCLLIIRAFVYEISVYSDGEPSGRTIKRLLFEKIEAKRNSLKELRSESSHFAVDTITPFVCSLSVSVMETIIKLLHESSTIESDAATASGVTEEVIDELAFDLHILLEREFLYNETINFRTFLMLFYLEAKNINSIDPFFVLSKTEEMELTENAEFLANADSSVEYYAHLFGEDLQEAIELYSKPPERPTSATKGVKSKKDIAEVIESKPYQHNYECLQQLSKVPSEFEYKESLAKSIYAHISKGYNAEPISARGKKVDPKREESEIILHRALAGVFFADMESETLFSSALELVLEGDERILQQNGPLDRISMQEMLVDVVLTICNVSAIPKLQIFDNFVSKRDPIKVEESEEAAKQERAKLISDIVDKMDFNPPIETSLKGRSGKLSTDPDVSIEHSTSGLFEELERRLSNVVFYPADALVLERMPRESALSRLEKTNLILESSAQIAVSLEPPVKKIGKMLTDISKANNDTAVIGKQSRLSESENKSEIDQISAFQPVESEIAQNIVIATNSEQAAKFDPRQSASAIREVAGEIHKFETSDDRQYVHTDSSSFVGSDGDGEMNELVLSKYDNDHSEKSIEQNADKAENEISLPILENRCDFLHEMRIEAFRQEFNTFIDSLFTETVENAVALHLENLEAHEEDVDDFEVLQTKMVELKSGELTYEEAGVDPADYEDPDEMQPPVRPIPQMLFKEVDEIAEINEQSLLREAQLLFCLNNNVDLLRSVAFYIYRTFENMVMILTEQIGEEQSSELGIQLTALLQKIGSELEELPINSCSNKEDGCRSQSAKKNINDKPIPPLSQYRSHLFAAIVKYGDALGLHFALSEGLNAGQLDALTELNGNLPSSSITILETVTNNVIDLQEINELIFENPRKLIAKPHAEALLLSRTGLFGSATPSVVYIDEFIDLTPDFCRQAFERLGISFKETNVKDKHKIEPKPDEMPENRSLVTESFELPRPVEEEEHRIPEGSEDSEELEEVEASTEHIAPYLREVSQETTARHEVWAYLFSEAIERAFNWCDVAPRAEKNWEKAVNYLLREWEEFYDE